MVSIGCAPRDGSINRVQHRRDASDAGCAFSRKSRRGKCTFRLVDAYDAREMGPVLIAVIVIAAAVSVAGSGTMKVSEKSRA